PKRDQSSDGCRVVVWAGAGVAPAVSVAVAVPVVLLLWPPPLQPATVASRPSAASRRVKLILSQGRERSLYARRHVLVPAQHVVRVVARLQLAQPVEGVLAERGSHALDRLVRLHVVHVPPADRERLDRRRGLARPGDLLLVVRGVEPGGHDADVERGV